MGAALIAGLPIRLLMVEVHPIVRASVRRVIESEIAIDATEVADGVEALAATKSGRFDLIIADLNLPTLGGLELLRRMKQARSGPVLVLSVQVEPVFVAKALAEGVQGYVSKTATPHELLHAIREILAGRRYVEAALAQAMALKSDSALDRLSPRDIEIVRLLARGRSLDDIADALDRGYKTIANNCTQIKAKLGVRRTTELVNFAIRSGLN